MTFPQETSRRLEVLALNSKDQPRLALLMNLDRDGLSPAHRTCSGTPGHTSVLCSEAGAELKVTIEQRLSFWSGDSGLGRL